MQLWGQKSQTFKKIFLQLVVAKLKFRWFQVPSWIKFNWVKGFHQTEGAWALPPLDILSNLDPDAFILLKQWRVNITLVIIFILDIVNSIHPVQNLLEQIMANSLHFKHSRFC